MEDKIDKVLDKVGKLEVHLERNTVTLEEHVRRTRNLEERLEPIENKVLLVTAIGGWFVGSAGVAFVLAMIRFLVG